MGPDPAGERGSVLRVQNPKGASPHAFAYSFLRLFFSCMPALIPCGGFCHLLPLPCMASMHHDSKHLVAAHRGFQCGGHVWSSAHMHILCNTLCFWATYCAFGVPNSTPPSYQVVRTCIAFRAIRGGITSLAACRISGAQSTRDHSM